MGRWVGGGRLEAVVSPITLSQTNCFRKGHRQFHIPKAENCIRFLDEALKTEKNIPC